MKQKYIRKAMLECSVRYILCVLVCVCVFVCVCVCVCVFVCVCVCVFVCVVVQIFLLTSLAVQRVHEVWWQKNTAKCRVSVLASWNNFVILRRVLWNGRRCLHRGYPQVLYWDFCVKCSCCLKYLFIGRKCNKKLEMLHRNKFHILNFSLSVVKAINSRKTISILF